VARNGLAAVDEAQSFRPEVVLLDIGLPGIDGYEVARRLRGGRKSKVLVAMTGYGQESDRIRSEQAGFDFHLTKPVDPVDLQQLLDGLPDPVSQRSAA
jgi:CheY-like chemotaxis protein